MYTWKWNYRKFQPKNFFLSILFETKHIEFALSFKMTGSKTKKKNKFGSIFVVNTQI